MTSTGRTSTAGARAVTKTPTPDGAAEANTMTITTAAGHPRTRMAAEAAAGTTADLYWDPDEVLRIEPI